jgi:hypothetical protein
MSVNQDRGEPDSQPSAPLATISTGHGVDPWELLTAPGTLRFDLPGVRATRRGLVRRMRALPAGATFVVCCTAAASAWRCRRFASDAGIEVLREYVAIPSAGSPTCYVEDTPVALRHFLLQVLALPRGGAVISALLRAVKAISAVVFPWAFIGAVAPSRVVLGRIPMSAKTQPAARLEHAASHTNLLDVPGMNAVVLALSKDPNAKLTVLLIPHGSPRPTLAVKVPTTEAAEASVAAEGRVLTDLHARWPGTALATIPRIADLPGVDGGSALIATVMPGSLMATRYHAWRHVATPALVQADFRAVDAWLTQFQRATAGPLAPIDMDGGSTGVLRRRFADDPRLDRTMARLGVIHARLRMSGTPRTAVHGDFWFGNLLLVGEEISGVVDWEAGSICGEPVRDLVRFAITYALYMDRHTSPGQRVAGHGDLRAGVWGSGIEFGIDGEGWFPDLFRKFVKDGLSRLRADPDCWREATLAGLAEIAATADHDAFARLHWKLFERLADHDRMVAREPASA